MYENCHILARGIDGDAVMHVFFSVQWCPLELSGHPHHLQSPLLSKFRVDWAQGALSAVRVLIPGCCKSIQRCKSAAMRCNSARVGPVAVKVPGPTTCTARRPRVRKLQDLSHQVQRRGQRQYPTNITYSITTRRPIPPPLTTHPSHPIPLPHHHPPPKPSHPAASCPTPSPTHHPSHPHSISLPLQLQTHPITNRHYCHPIIYTRVYIVYRHRQAQWLQPQSLVCGKHWLAAVRVGGQQSASWVLYINLIFIHINLVVSVSWVLHENINSTAGVRVSGTQHASWHSSRHDSQWHWLWGECAKIFCEKSACTWAALISNSWVQLTCL